MSTLKIDVLFHLINSLLASRQVAHVKTPVQAPDLYLHKGFRPPFWDSKSYGEPFGHFNRGPTTVAGAIQHPAGHQDVSPRKDTPPYKREHRTGCLFSIEEVCTCNTEAGRHLRATIGNKLHCEWAVGSTYHAIIWICGKRLKQDCIAPTRI